MRMRTFPQEPDGYWESVFFKFGNRRGPGTKIFKNRELARTGRVPWIPGSYRANKTNS